MFRSNRHQLRIVRPALMFALASLLMLPRLAGASTITWQYNLLVHGTAVGLSPLQLITIPPGTPMIVTVSFDTNTPNICPGDTQSGIYLIGFGNSNRASVDLLGYQYSASGGIEFAGACVGPSTAVRLFVSGGVQTDPTGTLIQWLPAPAFGNLYLPIPPSSWLGTAYPSALAPWSSPIGGGPNFIGSSQPNLVIESGDLRLVPEPSTWLLLSTGLAVVARRRFTKRR
jgi:hypothetical protein